MDDQVISKAVEALKGLNPKSIFLYGSRGRGDAMPDSDYELGVIFNDEVYVSRSKIHEMINDPSIKAYPFKWGELSTGEFDHVFQKSIYLREIIEGGRTVFGERLIENIEPVPITVLDLIQRLRFDIGQALAALLSYRSGDMPTSMEEFSKSCLFGLRCLEILELQKFPVGYKEIYNLSKDLNGVEDYKNVIDAAYTQRNAINPPELDIIFENISLLDTFIEPKIVNTFNSRGNVIVL